LLHPRYSRITTSHPYGPVNLTIYTPQDTEWIERSLHSFPVDLHTVRSAIVSIGDSFVVLEREIDRDNLHFAAQSYRPAEPSEDEFDEIHVDVLATYPL
jgi:hypothetical protein